MNNNNFDVDNDKDLGNEGDEGEEQDDDDDDVEDNDNKNNTISNNVYTSDILTLHSNPNLFKIDIIPYLALKQNIQTKKFKEINPTPLQDKGIPASMKKGHSRHCASFPFLPWLKFLS